MDRIGAGWRSWTNEKSLLHRVRLHRAFVEGLYPAPYGAPVPSLAASAPGFPNGTNDHLEPPKGAAERLAWQSLIRVDLSSGSCSSVAPVGGSGQEIPYAAMSETSANCWKFSVINEASCWEYLVDKPSRTSWMAA